jgi:hypothetical protein
LIETAHQQVRVLCTHGEVLRKVDNQVGCELRPEENRSRTNDAREAERSRLGTVCRGRKLDAKRDIQLLEARGPSSSSTSVSVRG